MGVAIARPALQSVRVIIDKRIFDFGLGVLKRFDGDDAGCFEWTLPRE
jgi:hypothetical protein